MTSNLRTQTFDISDIVDQHFADDSKCLDGAPHLVLILGGVAAGKTTLRKTMFNEGYVLVDAAEIFLCLEGWEDQPFPGELEEVLSIVGSLIARQAISERRHIVTELVGAETEPVISLIDAMQAIGYKVDARGVTCDIEQAMQRNLARGNDSISAYFAEPYQRQWLLDAAIEARSEAVV